MIGEQAIFILDIKKKSGLRTKMKSFHSGYSDQEVRIKLYPF